MGKVARDVTLLAQSEVAELREGAGAERGGSSAMPHKRNPVGAIAVLACAQQAPGLAATLLAAMVQEHERGAGGWQAEWPSLGVLLRLTGSASSSLRTVLEEAELDAERMRANISEQSMSESVTVALAKVTDPRQARSAVAEAATRASSAGRSFREVLLELDPVRDKLGSDGLDRALDPASYLGATNMLIDAALHARADMRDDDE
jgi:3-carboxy-cis,cis-muconate cycloisomerase